MIEWSYFGYWAHNVGDYLGEWITFDNLESLYKDGFYMLDYNHAVIPIQRFYELRCLHERYRTTIFSGSHSLFVHKISS